MGGTDEKKIKEEKTNKIHTEIGIFRLETRMKSDRNVSGQEVNKLETNTNN